MRAPTHHRIRSKLLETFDIAKLKVQMDARGDLLYARTRAYLCDPTDEPDMVLDLPEDVFQKKHEQFPQLTLDECRYVWTGEAFYARLLRFSGLLMHASCVEKDGKAYLFSAKSGTGKSTHTALWLGEFENTRIINDDKPALRKIDGRFYACGTPFSGKFDISENVQIPVHALVFLQRGAENKIEPISAAEAIPLFLSQTLRPHVRDAMDRMLSLLGELLESVPVFRLTCNMDVSAAHTAFEGIEKFYQQNGEMYED